jgi:20S proteasome subunit beta 7
MNFAEGEKKYTTSPVYVGSSVIGMKYKTGVVIACDTRLNYGSLAKFQNIDDRIQQVNANTMIGSAGEYSDFQEVMRVLKESAISDYLEGRSFLGPDEFTNYLSSLHYHRRNKMNPYWNYTVMGGIDWNGKGVLSSIDQYGTLLKSDYMLVGMAQYFCNAIIAPEYPRTADEFSLDQTLNLLRKCFETLFYRDTRAGNRIKFAIMDTSTGQITYEEKFEDLKTEWNYDRFKHQANEKIYLTNY